MCGVRLTPVRTDRDDQLLSLIDPAWIGPDPLLARHTAPTQASRRVDVMWVVAATEVERTPEHADCVVECFSAAAVRIRQARECHVVDPQQRQGAYSRTPECIEHASIARDCRPREIVPPEP